MPQTEKLQLVVLDLDTFAGSERFIQETRAGRSFSAGLEAYLNANYAKAAEEFRLALIAAYVEGEGEATVTDRDRSIIYLYVGNSMAMTSDWEGAQREYLNAVQTDSALAEAHYNMGVSFAAKGQIEKAISAFKEGLKYNPDLYEAKFALGRCYQAMDNPGAAYIFYTAAHDCRPDAAEPLYYIGLMHQAHGAHELAQKCFAEALRVEPTFKMAEGVMDQVEGRSEKEAIEWYYRLADDLKVQGYPEEAERIYHALLQWKHSENRARYYLGNLLARQKRWKDALNEYRQVGETSPEYIAACVKMSHVFRLLKQPKVAYQLLYRCAQKHPRSADVFQELGKVLAILGRLPQALKCLQQAVRLDARNPQLFYLLGRLYMAVNSEALALSVWKKALALAPQLVSLHYDMGVIHLKRGRFRQAIQELQVVLKQWPDDIETHYLLGLAFKEAGDPAQAIPRFERVIQSNPQHAQALYYLGACHLQLGNSTVGMAYLQQYDRLLRATTSVLGY